MTTMRSRQILGFFLATSCLLLGVVLYVLFRPTTLQIFHWADSLGLTESISTLRYLVHGSDRYLPNLIIYSLPFALWISFYLLFVSVIWAGSTSSIRFVWFWSIPIIAIAVELAQGLHLLPGYFDPVDLVTIIFATILASLLNKFPKLRKGVKTS